MEYKTVPANLSSGPKTISIVSEQSADLQTWSNTSISILGQDHYRASISVASGPQRWMRLKVTDPATP